jgi:hypothetical protein
MLSPTPFMKNSFLSGCKYDLKFLQAHRLISANVTALGG